MNKKYTVFAIAALLVTSLSVAGLAYAQEESPEGSCQREGGEGFNPENRPEGGRGPGRHFAAGSRQEGFSPENAPDGFGPQSNRLGFEKPDIGLDEIDREAFHEIVMENISSALGISVEELQESKDNGVKFIELAESLGYTTEDIPDLMKGAWAEALEQAVDENILTQEQADWLADKGGKLLRHRRKMHRSCENRLPEGAPALGDLSS